MTDTTVPIACTLSAQDGKSRLERWRKLGRQAAPTMRRTTNTIVVTYSATAGVEDELALLAGAESQCCSFLTWDVAVVDGRPTLTVTSPTGDASALDSVAGLWTAI